MSGEHDAFGRSTEDSGLGWPTSSESTPSGPTSSWTPDPGLPPSRRQWVIVAVLLVFVAVLAIVVVGVPSGSTGSTSSSRPGTDVIDDAADDDRVPRQVRVRSYLTAAGLRGGLRLLASEQPGRVTNFSVRRERIDVQVVRGRRSHYVQLARGAEVPQELSSSTAVTPGGFTYAELNARAPVRLMRAANARLRESPAGVDYYSASRFTGRLLWGVYYRSGKIAQGDARGRFIRRIS